MFSAVSRDQSLDRSFKSVVMGEQASVLLVEEENFGWTVVSRVKGDELQVTGKTLDEVDIDARESAVNSGKTLDEANIHARESAANSKIACDQDMQKNEAQQPETGPGSKVQKEGSQPAKRQFEVSKKGETEATVNAAKIREQKDDSEEEEEQEAADKEEDSEKDEAYQHKFVAVEQAYCTNVNRFYSGKDQHRRDPQPPREKKFMVQRQGQKPQAGRLWRVSLIAAVGILSWAVLFGGGLKLHSCSIKEREPVLDSHLKK